ncbi:MAG: extracellular solute-binding protein [Roseburia sp.]|nr:extracellular solute-binding protein [Roseburia sp.]
MKQRMKQRILAALLVTGMVISMVGCGDSEAGSKASENDVASTVNTQTEGTEIEAETEESTSLLPYTGEEINFTFFWFDMGDDFSDDTLPIVQALQEKLGNITLTTEILPITDYYTKYPLLLASGDVPDIMIIPDVNNTLTTYGPNGIFLDWAPLMEEYMPNLYQYSQELAMFDGLKNAEGNMYGLPIYVNSEDYIMQTWLANTTLLEELGIEIPETQEEFLEACRKVKAETGITPIQRRYGLSSLMYSVGLMYSNEGDRGLTYYPDEGKWDFGPARENSELKSYLTFLHTLWEENLIDHEINTMSTEQLQSYLDNGEFAFTHDYQSGYAYTLDDVPEFDVEVIPTPAGTSSKVGIDSAQDGKCVWAVVSDANTEHPELLAACIDLLFSEEMATYENYGIEGTTYEVGEDGQKYFMDTVKAASNYFAGELSLSDLGANKSPWLRTFGVTDANATRLSAESPEIYEGVNKIMDMLDAGEMKPLYAYNYPTLTDEENQEISDELTPVQTYLDECMVKFIMGDMDLEKDWDTFMTTLLGYGDMDRVCEILNSKEMPDYAGSWR